MFHYQKSALERKPVAGGDRFKWEAAVLACPDLSDAEARVLARLALHMNHTTGRLDVGIDALAKGANQKPRKTTETITKAEKLGLLKRTVGGGRKNTNSYQLLLQAETLHGDRVCGGNPACRRRKPCMPR
jgi:DNA-binding MarR family transcriptional regulator